jgi:transcriptional regulator with XRE-family HTH domain
MPDCTYYHQSLVFNMGDNKSSDKRRRFMKQKKGATKAADVDMSDVLRIMRIANDVAAKEVAESLGISPSYLSQIESGIKTPSMALLKRYSERFNVPVSAILKAQEVNKKEATLNERFSTKLFRVMKTLEDWGGLT